MRLHYAIALAVAASFLIGFGVKLFFLSDTQRSILAAAEADIPAVKNGSMNILQMHIDHPNIKNLPVLDNKDPF
jgi:hypothetical protein